MLEQGVDEDPSIPRDQAFMDRLEKATGRSRKYAQILPSSCGGMLSQAAGLCAALSCCGSLHRHLPLGLTKSCGQCSDLLFFATPWCSEPEPPLFLRLYEDWYMCKHCQFRHPDLRNAECEMLRRRMLQRAVSGQDKVFGEPEFADEDDPIELVCLHT